MRSVGALDFAAGPSLGEMHPLGRQRPAHHRSVGATDFAAGPPQGEVRPLGGQRPAQRRSVGALIFDMDGTMIDSMPWHTRSWVEFARRHGLDVDVPDLMRRTTGRNGLECVRELLGQHIGEAEAWHLVHEKETVYRELFGPVFTEVAGFKQFAAQAHARQLKIGVGTAGDIHNVDFALGKLALDPSPHTVVRGDEGLPGKPDPAIFLEAARRMNTEASACIVFEDAPFGIEAAHRAGMRAVALCTTHTPDQLAGPHVIAAVANFTELLDTHFLEKLHALPA